MPIRNKYNHGGIRPKKSETNIPLSQASGGFQLYRQFRDDGTSFITPTPYNSNYVKISDRGYYGTEDEGISPIMLGEAEVVADDPNRDPMDSIDKVVNRTGAGVYGDMYRTTTPEKRLEHLMGVLNSQDEFARYGIQAAGFAPGAGEAIDMINIPWAAATGTDIYTGRPMGTTEAAAWGVGGLVLPNILQKPMQWLIRKGAKNANDIKRLISPYIRNIKDAPADLKPLLELSKKSDGMKTYLSKYEADPNVFGGGPIQGRRPSDALVDYLAETNPELLLKFSPENASKGMFDEFTQGWVRNYNKGFRGGRGIYKDTPGRFGVTPGFSPEDMLLKPSGHVGDISGKSLGTGKYFTDDIGTASDYASIYKNWMDPNAWSKVGVVQMFPEIGRQGQSMGDILKHININETIGQTTLGLRSPGFGMQTRATGRFPERVLRSGPASDAQVLDIFDVGRFGMSSSDLAKYSPDFGGVGSIVTPDFTKVNPFTLAPTKPRGTEGIIESLIPTKEKGGILQSMTKKYNKGGRNTALRSLVKKYGAGGGVADFGDVADSMSQDNFTSEYSSRQPEVNPLEDLNEEILSPDNQEINVINEEANASKGEQRALKGKVARRQAAKGAGKGALIGSVLPGVGTLLGAGIGAAVGGLGSLFANRKLKKKSHIMAKDGIKIKKRFYNHGGLHPEESDENDNVGFFEALKNANRRRIEKRGNRRIARTPVNTETSGNILQQLASAQKDGAMSAGYYNPYAKEIVMKSSLGSPEYEDVIEHEEAHVTQHSPILSFFNGEPSLRVQNPDIRRATRRLQNSIAKWQRKNPGQDFFGTMPTDENIPNEPEKFAAGYMLGMLPEGSRWTGGTHEYEAIAQGAKNEMEDFGIDLNKSYDEVLSDLKTLGSDAELKGKGIVNLRHLRNFMENPQFSDKQKELIMKSLR